MMNEAEWRVYYSVTSCPCESGIEQLAPGQVDGVLKVLVRGAGPKVGHAKGVREGHGGGVEPELPDVLLLGRDGHLGDVVHIHPGGSLQVAPDLRADGASRLQGGADGVGGGGGGRVRPAAQVEDDLGRTSLVGADTGQVAQVDELRLCI